MEIMNGTIEAFIEYLDQAFLELINIIKNGYVRQKHQDKSIDEISIVN